MGREAGGTGDAARVGVVTGAARGIGRACAGRVAPRVDTLVLADLDEAGLATAAAELAGVVARVETVVLDVADEAAAARLAEHVEAFGSLRDVVHAAGISPTMGDWSRIVTVDLVATARLIAALRPQAGAGTTLVCIASMAAHLMPPGDPQVERLLGDPLQDDFLARLGRAAGDGIRDPGTAYSVAKRGVLRVVEREAVALGAVGARICSVSPGIIDTPMGRQELDRQPGMAMLSDHTPMRRFGRAEDIAAVVAFLLSDDATFLTGCDVLVDGGVCAAVRQMMTAG